VNDRVLVAGVPWNLVAASGFVEDAFDTVAENPQRMEEAAQLYVRLMQVAASPQFSNAAVVAAAAMLLSTMYCFFVMSQPDDSIERAMVLAAMGKMEELLRKEETTNGSKTGLH